MMELHNENALNERQAARYIGVSAGALAASGVQRDTRRATSGLGKSSFGIARLILTRGLKPA